MAQVTNQAHVSFSYDGDEVVRTNHSNVVTTTIKDRYSLLVEKTAADDCFRPGDTITYFVRVVNNGCACLNDFLVADTLGGDSGLSYVVGTARVFIGGEMISVSPTSTSPLNFSIPNVVGKNDAFILQYNTVVSNDISVDVNEITNVVTVSASPCGCDCEDGDLRIEESSEFTITKCEYAEVLITKATTNDEVCCGEGVSYILTLTNTGTIDARNVVVTDVLPEAFNLTEVSMENNGVKYIYDPSEYSLDETNLLTLPNDVGAEILVPAIAPGVDNTTRIVLKGTI